MEKGLLSQVKTVKKSGDCVSAKYKLYLLKNVGCSAEAPCLDIEIDCIYPTLGKFILYSCTMVSKRSELETY